MSKSMREDLGLEPEDDPELGTAFRYLYTN